MSKRPAFVLLALGAVVGALFLVPASPGSASRGAGLSSVVLRGSQVGAGYRLKMRPDSHCLEFCVTLDLCGFDFKSEADRTARLQVDYVKTAKALKLSNEVVQYRSGGTAHAMRELRHAVATCPRVPVKSTVAGLGKLTYRIHRFTAPHLLRGAVGLKMRISGFHAGHHFSVQTVAIYQVRGDILSGVYVFARHKGDLPVAQAFAVHAAQASAANLTRS